MAKPSLVLKFFNGSVVIVCFLVSLHVLDGRVVFGDPEVALNGAV